MTNLEKRWGDESSARRPYKLSRQDRDRQPVRLRCALGYGLRRQCPQTFSVLPKRSRVYEETQTIARVPYSGALEIRGQTCESIHVVLCAGFTPAPRSLLPGGCAFAGRTTREPPRDRLVLGPESGSHRIWPSPSL
jgi:hypothetical protein